MSATLYRRQREILQYIKEYIREKEAAPTLQEIAKHFKLSSLATVHAHLSRLEEKGYIRRDYHGERGIEITDPHEGPLFREIVEVRIAGTITAGQPIEKAAGPAQYLNVPVDWVGNRAVAALRVQGDGFSDCSLLDGDHLILDIKSKPADATVGVVILDDGSAALRRIYIHREKQQFILQPFQQSDSFTLVPEVQLYGRVLSVYRSW
jgi:repressor LexA